MSEQHHHFPGCGHIPAPDYNNFPSQAVDPRRAYSGDDAMQDQPSYFETALALGSNAPMLAMEQGTEQAPGFYNGLPDYVTWDVWTPLIAARQHPPGADKPNL